MIDLGRLLADRGDTEEAEPLLRQAAVYGYPDAMRDLAALLERRGDGAEAKEWARRAEKARRSERRADRNRRAGSRG
jgi:hypothetical protein